MYKKIIELANGNDVNKELAIQLLQKSFNCTQEQAEREVNIIIPNHMTKFYDRKVAGVTFKGKCMLAEARIKTLNACMNAKNTDGYKFNGFYTIVRGRGFFIKIGEIYKLSITRITRDELKGNFQIYFYGTYDSKDKVLIFSREKLENEDEFGERECNELYIPEEIVKEYGLPEHLYNLLEAAKEKWLLDINSRKPDKKYYEMQKEKRKSIKRRKIYI